MLHRDAKVGARAVALAQGVAACQAGQHERWWRIKRLLLCLLERVADYEALRRDLLALQAEDAPDVG